MGNFSINHYSRIQVEPRDIKIDYVLDFAEIPTFELLRDWKLTETSNPADLQRAARMQATLWTEKLQIERNGTLLKPVIDSVDLVTAPGAGNMPVLRVTTHLRTASTPGTLSYEDKNFADRAGWKEIVIDASNGVALDKASQGHQDRSRALTQYPQDPTLAPPQDLRAQVEWTRAPLAVAQTVRPVPIPQPQVNVAPKAPFKTVPPPSTPAAAGTVVRGDYLSVLLGKQNLSLGVILIGILVAFGLGALHAFSPGHGKTIVAAYLVGSRGTYRHAAFLGAMVTFTHTISVFALGLATLFLSRYIVPEKVYPILGAISGLSIVVIGASLFRKRFRILRQRRSKLVIVHTHHAHTHDHAHGHIHEHEHELVLAHAHIHSHGHEHLHSHTHDDHHHHGDADHHHHDHSHDDHHHHHGPGGHTHIPEGDLSLKSLIALGASGGLVPCPSALVLLLSSIALGRTGLGLLLLIGFSVGLAGVLMAIGMVVLFAKSFFPDSKKSHAHPLFQLIPVLSAAIVVCIGVVMTGVSLGWIRPERFVG